MDFTWLTNLWQGLLDKLNSIVTFFGDLVKAVFVALWNLLLDALCYGVDMLTAVVKSALTALPQATAQSWSQYWAQVPQGVADVFIAVGGVQALSIITVAIGIRIVLQLIPFVRLGS